MVYGLGSGKNAENSAIHHFYDHIQNNGQYNAQDDRKQDGEEAGHIAHLEGEHT
jgi:hypothetical protein